MHWLQNRNLPYLDLQRTAEQVREAELDRARRALARGDAPEAVLEQLAHGLTQKYIHGPMAALNRSEQGEREQLLSMLPRLLPRVDRRR